MTCHCLFTACSQDYVGTNFALAFPGGLPSDGSLELHFTTDIDDWTLVTVEVPNEGARRVFEDYVRSGRQLVNILSYPVHFWSFLFLYLERFCD